MSKAIVDREFPGPSYSVARAPKSRKLSLAKRVLEWMPVADFIRAQGGFSSRFNHSVNRLTEVGGFAIPAAQGRFYFGDKLLIRVNTATIKKRLCDHYSDGSEVRWIGAHFLDGGDWGPLTAPVEQSLSHKEIIELLEMRQNFRSGERYGIYASKIRSGKPVLRNRIMLDSIEKLDSYFNYYLSVVENIEKNGILPQSKLRRDGQTGRNHRWTRTFWQDLAERDIGISIDADGNLVRHTNGKHRMAVAIALGIERIPVEIRLVHARWLSQQAKRLNLPPAKALPAALDEFTHARFE